MYFYYMGSIKGFFIFYGILLITKKWYRIGFVALAFIVSEVSLYTSDAQTDVHSLLQLLYYMFFILCTLMAFYSNYLLYQYIQNKQEKIQESQSFKELLDLLPDGIVLINHDMKAVYQNKVFKRRIL